MKYLVEALDIYEKRNIKDELLDRVPKKGERFEVDDERLELLLGKNKYNEPFVVVVETNIEEDKDSIKTEEDSEAEITSEEDKDLNNLNEASLDNVTKVNTSNIKVKGKK